MSYSHLKIHCSKDFLYKIKSKYPLTKYKKIYSKFYFIIKFLSSFRLIRSLAAIIIEFYQYDKTKNQNTLRSIDKLKEITSVKANDYKSDFGYTEITEMIGLFKYAGQIEENFPSPTESKQLYVSIEEIYPQIIEKNKINNFLNFGSYLSHTDSILAKKFPKTNFICADRSTYTKIVNEEMFGNINNMTFVDGDIFKFLNNNKFDNDLFFSARTLPLLPKEFIEELYHSVHASGFKYISLIEQIGISHQTNESYNFADEDKPANEIH